MKINKMISHKNKEKLEQLSNSLTKSSRSPDFWTVEQFIDFRIKEFGLDCEILLPNGDQAPMEMTLGELRSLYAS